MTYMRCPIFDEWINCDPTKCEFCGEGSEKLLMRRASKLFTNPKDALIAFKELVRRREAES